MGSLRHPLSKGDVGTTINYKRLPPVKGTPRSSNILKPPLCKGGWLAVRQDGGIVCSAADFKILQKDRITIPHPLSLRLAGAPFAGGSLFLFIFLYTFPNTVDTDPVCVAGSLPPLGQAATCRSFRGAR